MGGLALFFLLAGAGSALALRWRSARGNTPLNGCCG
jgi:hypothetical protein